MKRGGFWGLMTSLDITMSGLAIAAMFAVV